MGLAGHRIRPCYLGDWGAPISGGGEMFALKRQRLGHFVGHWKNKLMVQT